MASNLYKMPEFNAKNIYFTSVISGENSESRSLSNLKIRYPIQLLASHRAAFRVFRETSEYSLELQRPHPDFQPNPSVARSTDDYPETRDRGPSTRSSWADGKSVSRNCWQIWSGNRMTTRNGIFPLFYISRRSRNFRNTVDSLLIGPSDISELGNQIYGNQSDFY